MPSSRATTQTAGTTTRPARRLGLLAALATLLLLVVLGPAEGLPPNAPKLGMVCTPGGVSGSTHTFNLVANTGDVQTPDGNTVFMWSYANQDAPDNGDFQSPGPVLCVTQGETVVVNLTNTLPEPTSIVFPGQEGVTASGGAAGALTTEAAAANGTVSYSFTAGSPGTYLYESGSDVSTQVQMGLYGALVVRPSIGASFAYDATTQFDPSREYLLLLAEIDPDLHHAVEEAGNGASYDFNILHNHYYTINGRAFPDTVQDNDSSLLPSQPYGALVRIQPNTSTNNQPALLRMINAGTQNHPFHPHGNHTREIAQDGRLLVGPGGASASTERFGETIGAGQTEDYLLRWDNQTTDSSGTAFNDNWNPGSNPFPLAQPNYLNVTFKDARTWYSGSPYLGYKGTLPAGTTSLNICGEWYFPFHSHALNEFSNFNEGFGGMGTLLRVDPTGGCFTSPSSSTLVGGVLKSGTVSALTADDGSYYQINPKTTTLSGAINTTGSPTTALSAAVSSATQTSISVSSNAGWPAAPYYIRIGNEALRVTAKSGGPQTTWTVSRGQLDTTAASHPIGTAVAYVVGVASAAGFPSSGSFYVRVDSEVLQVTAGQGTRAWTVSRGQLGTAAATHTSLTAPVSALATDWYASFTGLVPGSQNLKITYKGENCGSTTATTCAALTTNLPQQTIQICNWTIGGVNGCSTATSAGWVTLPAPPAQPQAVGSTDLSSTWTLPGPADNYIGTGAYKGQVRVLVHTQRWTATNPTPFSTWGNFMQLVYDAP